MRRSGSGVKRFMTVSAMTAGALALALGTASCAMMHGARAGRPGLQVVVGNDVRPARDVVVFLQRPNGVKLRLGTVSPIPRAHLPTRRTSSRASISWWRRTTPELSWCRSGCHCHRTSNGWSGSLGLETRQRASCAKRSGLSEPFFLLLLFGVYSGILGLPSRRRSHDAHPESRSEARAPHVARGRRSRRAPHPTAAAAAPACERCGRSAPAQSETVRIGAAVRRTTLMRILMTNACSFNCHYCPMRRDRDMPRTLLKPDRARPHLPRRAAPRVVRRPVPHHGHSRTSREGDGRSDSRCSSCCARSMASPATST